MSAEGVGGVGGAGSAFSSSAGKVTPANGASGAGDALAKPVEVGSGANSGDTNVNVSNSNNFYSPECSMSTQDFAQMRSGAVFEISVGQEMEMNLKKLLELLIMIKLLEALGGQGG